MEDTGSPHRPDPARPGLPGTGSEPVTASERVPPPERPVGRWAIVSAITTVVMMGAFVVFAFYSFCMGGIPNCRDASPTIAGAMAGITYLGSLAGLITTVALAIWAYRIRHRQHRSPAGRWARQSAVVTLALLVGAGAFASAVPQMTVVLLYGAGVGLLATIVPALWALAHRR